MRSRLYKHCLLFGICFLTGSIGRAQSHESIIGAWRPKDKATEQVTIYQNKNGLYYGKTLTDKLIIKELKYNAEQKVYRGVMCPPDKNIDINIVLIQVGVDELKIVAKKFLLTKTFYFIRIK